MAVNPTTPSLQSPGQEYNPVSTASSQPGMMSALASEIPEVTVGADDPSGNSGNGSGGGIDWGELDSLFGNPSLGSVGTPNITDPTAVNAAGATTGGSGLSSILNSMGLTASNLGALAPELAVAGVGLAQAKGAQADAAKQASQLSDASKPFLTASQSLLSQFQSGKLSPQQQSYVDFTSQEGQALINSGAGLQAIAQQAFGNYASGQLPQADQIQLDAQTAAQKQQVASMLAGQGIHDSSILAGYNQQIDNQAMVTKQNLLDARFQTGVQAYNTWLNSTAEGITVKAQGAQFAQSAFQDMMNDALGLESAGMSGLTQAIALTIQSDNQLSASVSQLMGNLASAYAYTISGPGAAARNGSAGSSGAAAGAGGIIGSIVSKGVNTAVNSGINSLFGGGAASAATGGLESVGTGAAASAADEGFASATAALDGIPSTAGGVAAGAAGAAAGGGAAAGAGAPGVFASGNAAAGTAGASSGLSGAAAAAAPLAFAAIAGIAISDALSAEATNNEGNKAMNSWMKASGVTFKPAPTQSNVGQNTFGTVNQNGKTEGPGVSTSPGTFIGPNGQTMSPTQARTALLSWAQANGVPTGNLG